MMSDAQIDIDALVSASEQVADRVVSYSREHAGRLRMAEVGHVTYVGDGIARVDGLPGAASQEILEFGTGARGTAFSLLENDIAVMLIDRSELVSAGDRVRRTGRVVSVPVGYEMLGRVVDSLGRPIDEAGRLEPDEHRPIERPSPGIMDRNPVNRPLQTGVQVVDALVPIGRGQRELIVGDRQTGKTAIAIDTIINQKSSEVICVYCGVGQRTSAVSRVVDDLRSHGVLDKTVVVVATEDEPPGANFVAPYAATSIAEFFVDEGRDVVIIYDDLTRHARSYRELSLLLRRPPAREAYPGDIFYIHSRLLERATQMDEEHGGGSLTALPVVETEEENLSAYIPTNLISITDGQIYLSPTLNQKGVLPAVDVGKSVSRVGGSAQADPYRAVAGDLRLSYSQFEELENFARFGVRLDEETQQTLARGRRVRELLKQPQYQPLSVPEQIVALTAVTEGAFDRVPLERMRDAKTRVRRAFGSQREDLVEKLRRGQALSDDERGGMIELIDRVVEEMMNGDEAET
ncbi:MAG: alternate F1F0 ATPase, F1 subunit alpha [Spirochaetota bacterium]